MFASQLARSFLFNVPCLTNSGNGPFSYSPPMDTGVTALCMCVGYYLMCMQVSMYLYKCI